MNQTRHNVRERKRAHKHTRRTVGFQLAVSLQQQQQQQLDGCHVGTTGSH